MKLTLVILFALCVSLTGCAAPDSSISSSSFSTKLSSLDSSILNKEKAQQAIDSWASTVKGTGCATESCQAEVENVREIPAENMAVANIKLTNFVYIFSPFI